MFISRKRFEEMERKIEDMNGEIIDLRDTLTYSNGRIAELEYCHHNDGMSVRSDRLHRSYNKYIHHNQIQSAQTSLLGAVTLQDLASLLIDNKPIVREDNVKVRKEFII